MGGALKFVGNGLRHTTSAFRRTLAAPFRLAEGISSIAVHAPNTALNFGTWVFNRGKHLSNKLFGTKFTPTKYDKLSPTEYNKYGEVGKDIKATEYSKQPGSEFWYGTSSLSAPPSTMRRAGRFIGDLAMGVPNVFRRAGDFIAGKPEVRFSSGWKPWFVDNLKDWASAGLTGITASTLANYIAPESGYYWKYKHDDGETWLRADPNSLYPRLRMEPRLDESGENPELKYTLKYRNPDGELVAANPWAVRLANTLRIIPKATNTMAVPAIARYAIPKLFSPEKGERRFGTAGENNEFKDLYKHVKFPEEVSSHDTPFASYLTRSAELTRLYADNIKNRMSELYRTKSPTELREMLSGDKAALADYLMAGVKEPDYGFGPTEAFTGLTYGATRDGIRKQLIEKLEKGLSDPNIARGAAYVSTAGRMPGIGGQVDEVVNDAITAMMSNTDREILNSYIKVFKKDDNAFANFISNALGLNASDILDSVDTGIRDGNKRIITRMIKDINKRQN